MTSCQTPQQTAELGIEYAVWAYSIPSNSPRLFCCSVDEVIQAKPEATSISNPHLLSGRRPVINEIGV